MSSTEIINKTGKSLKLKVGNNLVFTDLTVLSKDSSYKVQVDPNATYQEYLMGRDRNGQPLIISSDDCADNKSITIVEEADGKYTTIKKPRGSVPPLSPLRTGENSSSGGYTRSGSKIWKFFSGFRSSH